MFNKNKREGVKTFPTYTFHEEQKKYKNNKIINSSIFAQYAGSSILVLVFYFLVILYFNKLEY